MDRTRFVEFNAFLSANRVLFNALSGNKKAARHMLKAGTDPNGIHNDFLPPLHFAAAKGYTHAVRLLLEHGADISLKTVNKQETALHYASDSINTADTCKLLLESGANCNERGRHDITPFLFALRKHNMECIQLFLDHGADITSVDQHGMTALHYAARNYEDVEVIRFVLKQRLDIECSDAHNFAPLHWACMEGTPEACELLLKRGAMVNKPITAGVTPIILAVKRNTIFSSTARIVQLLLDYGANVADPFRDDNALEIVASSHESIGNILLQHIAKEKYLDLKVIAEDVLQTIENKGSYKNYYQRCMREIEHMKRIKFFRDLFISDLFGSQKLISEYARDEDLVRALADRNFGNRFPIYFPSLQKRFRVEVRKQRAARILSNTFKLNDPSHLVNEKVLSFLREKDIKFLEKCGNFVE